MRPVPFILAVLFLRQGQAQEDTVIRYWREAVPVHFKSQAKTEAKYFRKNGLWFMESRFLSHGGLYMTGSYKEREAKTRQGEFKWYFENGRLSGTAFFVDDLAEGWYKTWHENGTLRDSLFYRKGRLVQNGGSWNEEGQPTALYELDENGNGFGKNFTGWDSLTGEGPYLNSARQGTWVYRTKQGNKAWEVEYLKDSAVSWQCFDSLGQPQKDCIWEREAEPAGGAEGWKAYLMKALAKANYPSRKTLRKEKNLSGTVYARFLVEKDGSIIEVRILAPLNPEADRIVEEVLKKAPRWTPGIQRNRVLRSFHTQPVSFKVDLRD